MLVLIDESGCPGFKLSNGSSQYFFMAMVIFNSVSEAERTSNAIAKLKEKLKIRTEIKFAKTRPTIKDQFFNEVIKYNFKIKVLYINKKDFIMTHSNLLTSQNNFYNYFIRNLLRCYGGALNDATIKIDGNGNFNLKNAITSYLRKLHGSNKVSKLKFVDSKKDLLIQLADMSVGAIAKHYNSQSKESSQWFSALASKIDNIMELKKGVTIL